MGGRVRKGTCIVSGVVPEWIRDFLDASKARLNLNSRSKVIGFVLIEYSESQRKKELRNGRL